MGSQAGWFATNVGRWLLKIRQFSHINNSKELRYDLLSHFFDDLSYC